MTTQEEQLAALQVENSTLQEKINLLEALLKEIELNKDIPLATSYVVADPLEDINEQTG